AFDLNGLSDPAAIGYIFLALNIIFLFLGKINLWHSRGREKAADLAAIRELCDLKIFESAFARLSQQNLSYPNPSKLEVLWRYSHPPIRDRIAYAVKYQDSRS
ncbi:MAG: M48 family metalloprotease, partial [Candidatus Kariarchaeaceae archaeon]